MDHTIVHGNTDLIVALVRHIIAVYVFKYSARPCWRFSAAVFLLSFDPLPVVLFVDPRAGGSAASQFALLMAARALEAGCSRNERVVSHRLPPLLLPIYRRKSAAGGNAILIFMPGVREISDVVEALQRAERTSLHVLPLHGQLSSAAQREVFKRPRAGLTKVVVATNVAEASVTIDDIGYVIDAGVHKVGSPFTPLIPPFSPHSRHARVRARARTIALSLSATGAHFAAVTLTQPNLSRAHPARAFTPPAPPTRSGTRSPELMLPNM